MVEMFSFAFIHCFFAVLVKIPTLYLLGRVKGYESPPVKSFCSLPKLISFEYFLLLSSLKLYGSNAAAVRGEFSGSSKTFWFEYKQFSSGRVN